MNALGKLTNEVNARDALPLKVRAIEIEADHIRETGSVEKREIVVGRFEVAHRALTRMAFEIKGDASTLTGFEESPKPLTKKFQTHAVNIWNRVAADF